MKDYDQGKWGFAFIWTCDGSVIPKALVWAIPSATATALVNYIYYDQLELLPWDTASHITAVWSGFTFVLGFLVVFRSQQAYSRYWEGASLLRQIRGEWLNAASSLIAFCSTDRQRRAEVEAYQHLLVRLVSMLHSCALQTVADMEDAAFDRFSDQGFNRESLNFLASLEDKRHRCEVLTQWIQRHICNGVNNGLVPIAPPILSRVYQEISHGVVNLSNARKLTEIPFPFPISQLLQVMLFLYFFLTPAIAGLLMQTKVWAAIFTFCAVFSFTGVNYIAMEIECPFGNDRNDLPLERMQEEMNDSLWILLEQRAQETPAFHFDKGCHRSYTDIRASFSIVQGVDVRKDKKKKAKPKFERRTSIKFTQLRNLASRESIFRSIPVGGVQKTKSNQSSRSGRSEASVSSSDDGGPTIGAEPAVTSDAAVDLADVMSDWGNEPAEPEEEQSVADMRMSQDEEEEIMNLPKDEASPRILPAAHKGRGAWFTSQSARTPPITSRLSASLPPITSSMITPRHQELLAPPFSPSPYLAQKLTGMLLELPQSAHRLDVIPECSLEERLDQGFTALRTSMTLHIGSIVALLQQQMQREMQQDRTLSSPGAPFTPATAARCS